LFNKGKQQNGFGGGSGRAYVEKGTKADYSSYFYTRKVGIKRGGEETIISEKGAEKPPPQNPQEKKHRNDFLRLKRSEGGRLWNWEDNQKREEDHAAGTPLEHVNAGKKKLGRFRRILARKEKRPSVGTWEYPCIVSLLYYL